ncbi:bacteriophage Mu I protein GP32 [Actinobacillus minor NM305]|uniref:Bacteriophage Mu I protein GP32 n=1 Tax=Actinobacillus minor NM305 TaxID=637911 RepID=C5S0Q0_9PAST|nr:bacteriophage Mu I protein GP32 [Actinobacillus minor]EER47483.1 bacteriophage Mu I protein GP32 [Actinobacillus minor NM305]MDY5107616.1 phage protease [Actinobacillus minor]
MKLTPIACSFEIALDEVNGRIHLTPYGRFYPADGRDEQGGWYVDDSNGYLLADELNARKVDAMIDYEHKTLRAQEFAEPNPAAGWVKKAGEAEAATIRVKGEALKENRQLVELTAAEKWNGVLPTTITPKCFAVCEGSIICLNI